MLVTDLKKIDDKRQCLYIDYEPFAPVYVSDIRRLHITVGEDMDDDKLMAFRDEYLYKRAMNKAIASIKYSEKCEYDIRKKLTELYYDKDIIDTTVDKLKKYGYIDDYRYASIYIRTHINKASRRNIEYILSGKNIDSDIISDAFEENELPDEAVVVENIINKKYKKCDLCDRRDKIISYLMGKGYSYRLVNECINHIISL
jgi:regulatory protein